MNNDLSAGPLKALCECQNCKIKIEIDYILLGSSHTCPGCLRMTIPIIPNGGPIPVSSHQLTYTEFVSLLADPSTNPQISNFLIKNFGYSLNKNNSYWMIMNSSNEAIERLWLHLSIQQDKKLSADLYNLAMSAWHS
jgi:hypothetical protein